MDDAREALAIDISGRTGADFAAASKARMAASREMASLRALLELDEPVTTGG